MKAACAEKSDCCSSGSEESQRGPERCSSTRNIAMRLFYPHGRQGRSPRHYGALLRRPPRGRARRRRVRRRALGACLGLRIQHCGRVANPRRTLRNLRQRCAQVGAGTVACGQLPAPPAIERAVRVPSSKRCVPRLCARVADCWFQQEHGPTLAVDGRSPFPSGGKRRIRFWRARGTQPVSSAQASVLYRSTRHAGRVHEGDPGEARSSVLAHGPILGRCAATEVRPRGLAAESMTAGVTFVSCRPLPGLGIFADGSSGRGS